MVSTIVCWWSMKYENCYILENYNYISFNQKQTIYQVFYLIVADLCGVKRGTLTAYKISWVYYKINGVFVWLFKMPSSCVTQKVHLLYT